MKLKDNPDVEIVERSSGFWVVGGPLSEPEGPFMEVKEAQDWIDEADAFAADDKDLE